MPGPVQGQVHQNTWGRGPWSLPLFTCPRGGEVALAGETLRLHTRFHVNYHLLSLKPHTCHEDRHHHRQGGLLPATITAVTTAIRQTALQP